MTTVAWKTTRTTGRCQVHPCDASYSGRPHTVPDSGIVIHRQNWLYEPDIVQVGMFCTEDVGHGEPAGEWQAYIQFDHMGKPALIPLPQDAGGGSEHHFAEAVVTALMKSVIAVERANASRGWVTQ